MLDPRDWEREHQVALIAAFAIGVVAGAVVLEFLPGRYGVRSCGLSYLFSSLFDFDQYWARRLGRIVGKCWDLYFFWPLFGGLIGGGIVYIRQLLRS